MIAEFLWGGYLGGALMTTRMTYVRLRGVTYDKLIHSKTNGRPHQITGAQLAQVDNWYRNYESMPVVLKTVGMAVWWPVAIPVSLLFMTPRAKGLEKTALDAVEARQLQDRIQELEEENRRYRDGLL